MLFKLLVDYRPKGVVVAWDTRPVHRKEVSERYKAERPEMPDLLREQFAHFRPLVEAFGYRNLEFEGWEADDVIATLATRADEAGIRTCVVSTDRDAFQLCSGNVCLMMTPRGVSDVQVYTPERVEARYGIPPAKVPDFIGLKGDPSDKIEGVPGIGDKTAAELVAEFGSLEEILDNLDGVSPAARTTLAEHAEQARHVQAPRHDAARPRARLRPGGGRARAARPLRAQGDVPAVRVSQPAAEGSTSSRPRCPRPRKRPGATSSSSPGSEGEPGRRRPGRCRSPPTDGWQSEAGRAVVVRAFQADDLRAGEIVATTSRLFPTSSRVSGSARPTTR